MGTGWHSVNADRHGMPKCCNGGSCMFSFCSPQSGRCYDEEKTNPKPYYEYCLTTSAYDNPGAYPECCKQAGMNYQSPKSRKCYKSKNKAYYMSCAELLDVSGWTPAMDHYEDHY